MQTTDHINALVAKHDAALKAKDFEALKACYTENAKLIDIKAIVVGRDAIAKLWLDCLPFFDKPIVVHRKNMEDAVTKHMVVRSYLSRVSGMKGEENIPEMWLRGTSCFIKTDAVDECDGFKICHEHASFAVQMSGAGMDVVGA